MTPSMKQAALDYHSKPTSGKIAIHATKPLTSTGDLSLAYSPGVAEPCLAIADDPFDSYTYTSRGNLVAVCSNGTAVLGLGNIGPEASKPVMEGKAVLFKKFSGIDAFDLEIRAATSDDFCRVVAALEPGFGGVNLEDIRAPECFDIEDRLVKEMKIPVFHDDQHGTAVVVSAALMNGLELQGKKLSDIRLVAIGAGAAGLATLDLLLTLGLNKENVIVLDRKGVVYEGRSSDMHPKLAFYSQRTDARNLMDVIQGVDVFLGLSAANVLSEQGLKKMADRPIIFALANPVPEVDPRLVETVRPDAIIATGRSDYPNQVNNVLCFPFIFRGALDVRATEINVQMKQAAVHSLSRLAHTPDPEQSVANEYGKDHIIPTPFDSRLLVEVTTAVVRAAIDSGVARRDIKDFELYQQSLKALIQP